MSQIDKLKKSSIKDRLIFLLKDSVLYGGATAVSRMFNILIFPLLTRIFTTAEVGALDGLIVVGIFLVVFIEMGQESAVARYFYDTDDKAEKKQIVTQGLIMEMFLAVLVCSSLYMLAPLIADAYLHSREQLDSLRVVILTLPLMALVNYCQNLLKWTFSRTKFLIMTLGNAALFVLLVVLLFFLVEKEVVNYFYARIIGLSIFAGLGLFFIAKELTRNISFNYVGRLFRYGWPLMILAGSSQILVLFNREYVIDYMGLEMLGIYAVGAKVAQLMQYPLMGFKTAWPPFAFALHKRDDAEETYGVVLNYFAIVFSLFCCALVVLAKPLTAIFAPPAFMIGIVVIVPLIFAHVAESFSHIKEIGISFSKKTN